tara:strand:- start:4524 stop:5495 length:972 start_codon:yes stop_codon:yes gene_type:complete
MPFILHQVPVLGPGRVITATFAHSTGEFLEFDIEGESAPLCVTGGHPLWSETAAETNLEEELTACCNSLNAAVNSSCGCEEPSIYSLPADEEQTCESLATAIMNFTMELLAPAEQTWVPAEEFQPGDSLKSLNGLRQITNRHLERSTERVYNIEVDGDHVYRVGQSGLLVHNASPSSCDNLKKEFKSKLPCKPKNGWPACPSSRDRANLVNSLGNHSYPRAQAHHIFPVRDFSSDLGKWLCCCGIDLNSSENGVWLPECDFPGRKASIHTGLDNGAVYTNIVRKRLNDADDCADALLILSQIKSELLNGTLKVNNADPAKHPC